MAEGDLLGWAPLVALAVLGAALVALVRARAARPSRRRAPPGAAPPRGRPGRVNPDAGGTEGDYGGCD